MTYQASAEILLEVKEHLQQHGVIAYPTEGVFGLGCLPDDSVAVKKILAMKGREQSKGLILIAADYSQLLPYVDDNAIPQDKRFSVFSHWPGHTTLILPARKQTPDYLTGNHQTIAVRVTNFEPVRTLCRALETPLVSTSANLQGQAAARTIEDVQTMFGDKVDWIMPAEVGTAQKSSRIFNPLTQETLRA